MTDTTDKQKKFTRYQAFVIAVLAFIQFSIVLDFMVMSPLGAILRPILKISPAQFATVVSAYAFSAGFAGLLAAGFADRFDRKKLLLFFYSGFVIGTLFCGLATSYELLLAARIITGIFGGVIGSISYAIITDLFKLEVRGTVMGFVQASFAGAQVLGLPVGLFMADKLGWQWAFFMIVAVCIVVGTLMAIYMMPVNEHLKIQTDRKPFEHLRKTISQGRYLKAFAATVLLATGGFMLMPFGADFAVRNLGVSSNDLWLLYLITGIFSLIAGPLVGRLSDKAGKYPVFVAGSLLSMVLVVYYCGLGITPFWFLVALNSFLFLGISARIISSSALMTAVPEPHDRGAFMSINASTQQIAGGIAAICAGLIVVEGPDGKLQNYSWLGYVVAICIVITIILMYPINKYVMKNQALLKKQAVPESKVNTESVNG